MPGSSLLPLWCTILVPAYTRMYRVHTLSTPGVTGMHCVHTLVHRNDTLFILQWHRGLPWATGFQIFTPNRGPLCSIFWPKLTPVFPGVNTVRTAFYRVWAWFRPKGGTAVLQRLARIDMFLVYKGVLANTGQHLAYPAGHAGRQDVTESPGPPESTLK